MFKRIAYTAGFTGLLAALLLTLLQSFWVVPLIQQAETYENAPAEHVHEQAGVVAEHSHEHDEAAWEPENGWQRVLSTTGGNLVVAVGFALMLAGLYTLRAPGSPLQGAGWGLAGFAVFVLAPTLGLPPELPGTAAAELSQRQLVDWHRSFYRCRPRAADLRSEPAAQSAGRCHSGCASCDRCAAAAGS